jgi:hypothetical protein
MEAADSKAVNYGTDRDLGLLIVWDTFGRCRAYATGIDHLHWSVPDLNDVDKNTSFIV